LVREFVRPLNVGLMSPRKKDIDRTNPVPEWDFGDMSETTVVSPLVETKEETKEKTKEETK